MCTLGIDYGTNSLRALLVRCEDGAELGTGIFNYPSGTQGVLLDPADPLLARQSPMDYVEGVLQVDPDVFHAAASWVELADWIPSLLCGVSDPSNIRRCACAAGHKALFDQSWGGLPDKEFLSALDPALTELRDRLYGEVFDISVPAGTLGSEWAERLGLPSGIPVAMGEFDVHYGAIGCGISEVNRRPLPNHERPAHPQRTSGQMKSHWSLVTGTQFTNHY